IARPAPCQPRSKQPDAHIPRVISGASPPRRIGRSASDGETIAALSFKLASRSEPDWHDCSIHPTIPLDRPTRFGSAYKARSDPVHALPTRFLAPTATTPAKYSNPMPALVREILIAIPRHRATSPPDGNAR